MGPSDKSPAGYFAGSILRKVHSERAVGLYYGQRALAIGAINPLNYVGTALHTATPERPFARIADTAILIEKVILGSKRDADKVLGAVERMHQGVEGELPRTTGNYAAGTPYSASDPKLMLWTVAVIADSAMYFFELFVRRLTGAEKAALWREYLRFAGLFGMDVSEAPQSYTEFRDWFDAEIKSPDAHLTAGARAMGRAIIFDIPFPWYLQGYARLRNVLLSVSLPPRVRRLYGIRVSPMQRRIFDVTAAAVHRSLQILPASVTRGSSSSLYARIKDYEKRRIEQGGASIRIAAY